MYSPIFASNKWSIFSNSIGLASPFELSPIAMMFPVDSESSKWRYKKKQRRRWRGCVLCEILRRDEMKGLGSLHHYAKVVSGIHFPFHPMRLSACAVQQKPVVNKKGLRSKYHHPMR